MFQQRVLACHHWRGRDPILGEEDFIIASGWYQLLGETKGWDTCFSVPAARQNAVHRTQEPNVVRSRTDSYWCTEKNHTLQPQQAWGGNVGAVPWNYGEHPNRQLAVLPQWRNRLVAMQPCESGEAPCAKDSAGLLEAATFRERPHLHLIRVQL